MNISSFETQSLLFESAKWLILFVLCASILCGLLKDSKRIEAFIIKHPEGDLETQALLHGMSSRNIQICALILLLIILNFANDIRSTLRSHTSNLTNSVSTPLKIASTEKPDTPAKQLAETPVQAASSPALPSSSLLPFTEITEFNEKEGRQEATLDWIKQRYEAWIVTYYYLKNCNKVDDKDLPIIMGSLERELSNLQQVNHDISNNILLAADGSYKEIYSFVPCDKDRIAATFTAYDKVMISIRNKNAQEKHS